MEFFFLSDSHSFSDTVAIADKVERKIPHLFFAYISHLVSYGLVHWSIFKPNSLCLFFCSSFLFSLSLPQVKEPVNHIKTSHSLLIFQSGLCNKKKKNQFYPSFLSHYPQPCCHYIYSIIGIFSCYCPFAHTSLSTCTHVAVCAYTCTRLNMYVCLFLYTCTLTEWLCLHKNIYVNISVCICIQNIMSLYLFLHSLLNLDTHPHLILLLPPCQLWTYESYLSSFKLCIFYRCSLIFCQNRKGWVRRDCIRDLRVWEKRKNKGELSGSWER